MGDFMGASAEILMSQAPMTPKLSDTLRSVADSAREILAEDRRCDKSRSKFVDEETRLPNSCSLLPTYPFEKVDSFALKAPVGPGKNCKNFVELGTILGSGRLTKDNDLNKARAIYRWMSTHIVYDPEAYFGDEPMYSVKAEDVWREKITVGHGYATLFKELAAAAGLFCRYVEGRAKIWSALEEKEVSCSHAWNMVRIGSCWGLVDACWGAGHVAESGKFVRAFDPSWFLTPPHIFAIRHFPEDPINQLLVHQMDKVAYVCGETVNDPAFKMTQAFKLQLVPLTHPDMVTYADADGRLTMLFSAGSPVNMTSSSEGGSSICDMDEDGRYRVRLAAPAGEGRLTILAQAPKGRERPEECYSYLVRSGKDCAAGLPRPGLLWRADMGCRLSEPLTGQLNGGTMVRFVVCLGAEMSNPVIVSAGSEWPMYRDGAGHWVAEVRVPSSGDLSLRRGAVAKSEGNSLKPESRRGRRAPRVAFSETRPVSRGGHSENPDVYLWFQIAGDDRSLKRPKRRARTRVVAKDLHSQAAQGKWDSMFSSLEVCPHLVNVVPEMISPSAKSLPGCGMTVLHHAAVAGDLVVLRRLLQDFNADPSVPGPGGKTPEEIALEHGHELFAEYLRETQQNYEETITNTLQTAASRDVKQAFQKWDADGSGTISKEELGHVLQELNPSFCQSSLDHLFKAADKDGNGDIDFAEFLAWLNL